MLTEIGGLSAMMFIADTAKQFCRTIVGALYGEAFCYGSRKRAKLRQTDGK